MFPKKTKNLGGVGNLINFEFQSTLKWNQKNTWKTSPKSRI